MKLWWTVIIIAEMLVGFSSNTKIFMKEEDDILGKEATVIAAIIGKCLESLDWPDLLLTENLSDQIVDQIYRKLGTPVYSVSKNARLNERENKLRCNSSHFDEYNCYIGNKKKVSAVLIATRHVEELKLTLEYLKNGVNQMWTSKAYYFVMLSRDSCDEANANDVVKEIWKFWILNAVVICHENNNTDPTRDETNLTLYTFNPYSKKHPPSWHPILQEDVLVSFHMREFSHSWNLFKREYGGTESFDDSEDLFFDKTTDLENYSIPMNVFSLPPYLLIDRNKSGMSRWSGEDGMTLRLMAEKLRFDVIEVPHDVMNVVGHRLPNGSYTGSLGYLVSGRTHLMMNGGHMILSSGLERLYPYGDSGICFVTRATGNYPQWSSIFKVWDHWVLGFNFTMMATVTSLFYVQNRRRGLSWGILNTLRMVTGTSVSSPSTRTVHRCILGGAFFVVTVLMGIFQGSLVSLLTIPKSYPDVDTMRQLNDKNLSIHGNIAHRRFFKDSEIRSRYQEEFYKDCIDSLENGGQQRACVTDRMVGQVVVLNSTRKLHQAAHCIMNYHLTYLTTPDWPIYDRFDIEIQKTVNAGLREKWRNDATTAIRMSAWSRRRSKASSHLKKFTVQQLILAFDLLPAGLFVATISFLAEIALAHLSRLYEGYSFKS